MTADVGEAMRRIPGNPVSVSVLVGRVVTLAGEQLWVRGPDDQIGRAWAPDHAASILVPDTPLELYVDGAGGLNGWWHRRSGLAVNHRLGAGAPRPPAGIPVQDVHLTASMRCLGTCDVTWMAPRGTRPKPSERCLECGAALEAAPDVPGEQAGPLS